MFLIKSTITNFKLELRLTSNIVIIIFNLKQTYL